MDQSIDIVRFVTMGCLLVVVYQLLKSQQGITRILPSATFAICCLSYLLVDWEPMRVYTVFYFFLIPAISLPYAFWIFSQSIFNDRFCLRRWMIWTWIGVVLMQVSLILMNKGPFIYPTPGLEILLVIMQHAISLIFVILAIVVALHDRDADLILTRFRFRNIFIILTAGLIFLTVLSEIAFKNQDIPDWLELSQKLFICLLTFYFAFRRLELKQDLFSGSSVSSNRSQPVRVDLKLIEKLNRYMDDDEGWRTEGLSIRQISEQMGIKEYKLRLAINQHLGFRNFNDFLHSYRIREACRLLTDPTKKDLTILEIAYEIGYTSLAPFNKAFKHINSMTPTEWRRSQD